MVDFFSPPELITNLILIDFPGFNLRIAKWAKKHNIPVIFYFSGVHEDYHKPGDDAHKILYNKMETITRLVFHTAWNVANRDERLKVDVVSDFKN